MDAHGRNERAPPPPPRAQIPGICKIKRMTILRKMSYFFFVKGFDPLPFKKILDPCLDNSLTAHALAITVAIMDLIRYLQKDRGD